MNPYFPTSSLQASPFSSLPLPFFISLTISPPSHFPLPFPSFFRPSLLASLLFLPSPFFVLPSSSPYSLPPHLSSTTLSFPSLPLSFPFPFLPFPPFIPYPKFNLHGATENHYCLRFLVAFQFWSRKLELVSFGLIWLLNRCLRLHLNILGDSWNIRKSQGDCFSHFVFCYILQSVSF